MKLIRWLLSHFFLILLIVIVIYSYMYWGNLAGRDTPAGEAIAYLSTEFEEFGEFVEAVREKQAGRTATVQQRGSQASDTDPDASEQATTESQALASADDGEAEPDAGDVAGNRSEEEGAVEPAPLPPASAQAEQKQAEPEPQAQSEPQPQPQPEAQAVAVQVPPVSLSYEYKRTPVNQTTVTPAADKPTAPANKANGAAVAEAPAAKERFVSEATVEQLNNLDQHGHVIDPAKQAEVIRKTWITARKSYYQRNYALSEESYRQVIENTQDNFDAWGELGNVYFNQGRKKEAAAAYFEAASILVRKGQLPRARSLIGLLRHLDADRAAELQKIIEAASSRAGS